MKFRRIDDDTVRCIVSKEDMQEYGINLEDFFKNKGKIHDFLHVVVERAEEEVGYEPKNGLLSMQIIPLSPNAISITFSEQGNEDYEEMINNIKGAVPGLDENNGLADNIIEMSDNEDDIDEYEDDEDENDEAGIDYANDSNVLDSPGGLNKMENSNESKIGTEQQPNKKSEEKKLENSILENAKVLLFCADSMDEIAGFCKTIEMRKPVKSECYRLNKKNLYCLIVEKGRLSVNDIKNMVLMAVEYRIRMTNQEEVIAYIREHAECIVEERAYKVLQKYF